MGYPERLLGPDEHLMLTLRPHVKALLRPALVLLATGPATGFLIGMVPDGSAAWLPLAVVAVAAATVGRWVLVPFLTWFTTLYVITDRRLVTRHGAMGRTGHDMPLTRLGDVRFSHGVVDRVLGCGRLVVESAGATGLVLDDVPRVEQVMEALYRLADAARARSSQEADAAGQEDDDFDDLLAPEETERATLVLDRRPGPADS